MTSAFIVGIVYLYNIYQLLYGHDDDYFVSLYYNMFYYIHDRGLRSRVLYIILHAYYNNRSTVVLQIIL